MEDICITTTLSISGGERYGLICLDNCAKQFLKHVEKEALHTPPDLNVVYWEDNIVSKNMNVIDFVLKPSNAVSKLLTERKNLKAKQEEGNDSKEMKERLAALWEELLMLDPNLTPAIEKAKRILSGLGISPRYQGKKIKNIPEVLGKRVGLARALFQEPTLLILYQPTARLDLNAVLWLQK